MFKTLYKNNLATTDDTDRGPSRAIWADCPAEEIHADQSKGMYFFDDFLTSPLVAAGAEAATGIYKGFASTGGSVATGDEQGGTIVLSSDGDDEGASLGGQHYPFQISRSHKKLWFECRIKTSTIDDSKHGIFVGLIDASTLSATVPIAAAGTLADENFVGFHRLEGDGDKFDTVYKANGVTQVTVQADAVTLVADTYVKLGFVYEPAYSPLDGGAYYLTFFGNGRRLATTKQIPSTDGDDFPNDVRLGLVVAVLNNTASTPGNTEMDWWACAQLFY